MKSNIRFVAYLKGSIQGPMDVADLWQLEGFSLDSSVCEVGTDAWKPAKDFDAIARYMLTQENPETEASPVKLHWRDAIIPSDVEEVSSPTRYSAVTLESGDYSKRKAVVPKTPKPSRASKFQKAFHRHRKGALLIGLSMIFMGVYEPQADMIMAISESLASPDSALPAVSILRKGNTSRIRKGPWKHDGVQSKTEAPKNSVSIVEIGSEDLGAGMIQKTIVETKMVDGVQRQETKTIVVPTKKSKVRSKKTSLLSLSGPSLS